MQAQPKLGPAVLSNAAKITGPITAANSGLNNTKNDQKSPENNEKTADKGGDNKENLDQESDGKSGKGMSEAFNSIYKILSLLLLLIFSVLLLVSLLNPIVYILKNRKKAKYIGESDDYIVLKYATVNTEIEEPYKIFAQQKIASSIFLIAKFAIFALSFQAGIYMALKMYSSLKGYVFTEQFTIVPKPLITILLITICAILINGEYNKVFITEIQQKDIQEKRLYCSNLRNYIYENISKDSEFLSALTSGNTATLNELIKTKIHSNDFKNCTDINAFCDDDVLKMVITYNLYTYFHDNYGERANDIDKMFTANANENRPIDIIQIFELTNIPDFKDRSSSLVGLDSLKVKGDKKKATSNSQCILNGQGGQTITRELIFKSKVESTINELNKRLGYIRDISTPKKKIFKYMVTILFYVLLFAFLLVMIYIKEINAKLSEVKIFKKFFKKKGGEDGNTGDGKEDETSNEKNKKVKLKTETEKAEPKPAEPSEPEKAGPAETEKAETVKQGGAMKKQKLKYKKQKI